MIQTFKIPVGDMHYLAVAIAPGINHPSPRTLVLVGLESETNARAVLVMHYPEDKEPDEIDETTDVKIDVFSEDYLTAELLATQILFADFVYHKIPMSEAVVDVMTSGTYVPVSFATSPEEFLEIAMDELNRVWESMEGALELQSGLGEDLAPVVHTDHGDMAITDTE